MTRFFSYYFSFFFQSLLSTVSLLAGDSFDILTGMGAKTSGGIGPGIGHGLRGIPPSTRIEVEGVCSFSGISCVGVVSITLSIGMSCFILSSCTFKKAKLGSIQNPVKIYFVPSVDAKVIENNSKTFKSFLEKNTPYHFEVAFPQSYISVVEAFGTKRADISAINSFGYLMAHEKYGVEARLMVLRDGESFYRSQFIVKDGSPIKKLSDLKGKKVAFVDSSSTSGYLLPLKTLRDQKIDPSQIVFAQKHDNVISMVYQGQVAAGATFYSPPDKTGAIQDARRLVKFQYPDVESKIRILALTEPIVNDPIVFRKDLSEEMKSTIAKAFVKFVQTPEGKVSFKSIYGVDGVKEASDADYEKLRDLIKSLGQQSLNSLSSKNKK